MNAVLTQWSRPLIARSFKLRFAGDVPSDVIQTVVDRWNAELARRFCGELVFPPAEDADLEITGESTVQVLPLLADAEGWEDFEVRGASLRPVVEATYVAKEQVVPMRIPALGAPSHTTL